MEMDLILDLEREALASCGLPDGSLYADGNLQDGVKVLLGTEGRGLSQADMDRFYCKFMSLLKARTIGGEL